MYEDERDRRRSGGGRIYGFIIMLLCWWRVRARGDTSCGVSNVVTIVGMSGRFWYRFGVFWRPYMGERAFGLV